MFGIIPQPKSVKEVQGEFVFSSATQICAPNDNVLRELNFLDMDGKGKLNRIDFVLEDGVKEDYVLTVDDDVKAVSSSEEGLFHAAQTLKQLAFQYYDNGYSYIKKCIIEDSPRFERRSFMLDVSRHFFGVGVVKKLIDALALVKMNALHLHLADNQGFRVQIDKYPLLAQVGSARKGTRGDNKEVKGYFTKADVAEIVKYAADRYIDVVPEIDLPGHTVAMLAAYPELGCTDEKYEVSEYFGIDSRILCAGKDGTYEFVYGMLKEVADMFPSKYLHIGGDEVPKVQWESCDACQDAIRKQGLRDCEDLQGYFTNKVIKYVLSLGKTPIVWNEALNSGTLDKGAVVQYWQDGKKHQVVNAAANSGRKMYVSEFFHYYVDYPYGMTPLKKTYAYEPVFDGLDELGEKNIFGVECPLWTEYVATEQKLWYQAFPRAFAVAETGWSDKGNKDYRSFEERLDNALGLLSALDIDFATVKESNPNPFKSVAQVVKFLANAFDTHALASMRNDRRAKSIKRTE